MTTRRRCLWLVPVMFCVGCAGANPFITAMLLQDNPVAPGQGGGTPGTGSGNISTTCDLPGNRSVFSGFVLQNNSSRRVSYAMTMLATAGAGGFICDADLTTYLNAGYRALPLDPSTLSATIGCDPVRLQSGTQLLGLTITGDIVASASPGDNMTFTLASAPLGGQTAIPIPQLIVLGNSQANFICQGNDACTQGGLAYVNDFGTIVAKITSQRTQGTICNARVGSRPEWLLLDPNSDDDQVSAFHFTAGSFVVLSVLNRAENNDPNVNQVVWQVFGFDGTVLHPPQP